MRLNPDYIRETLLYIRDNVGYDIEIATPYLISTHIMQNTKRECNIKEIEYAIKTLIEEDVFTYKVTPLIIDNVIEHAFITGLSMKGHNMLSAIEDEKIFAVAKSQVKGMVTIPNLFNAAKSAIILLKTNPSAFMDAFDKIKDIVH